MQRLSDLPRAKRLSFLSDMDQLGEAVERACRRLDPAFRRVNLEILENNGPVLARTGSTAFAHLIVATRFTLRSTGPEIGGQQGDDRDELVVVR